MWLAGDGRERYTNRQTMGFHRKDCFYRHSPLFLTIHCIRECYDQWRLIADCHYLGHFRRILVGSLDVSWKFRIFAHE